MKTIILEVEDRFDAELTELAQTLRLSRSLVIRVAVESYRKQLEREAMAKRVGPAALKVRGQTAGAELALGEASGDGLSPTGRRGTGALERP